MNKAFFCVVLITASLLFSCVKQENNKESYLYFDKIKGTLSDNIKEGNKYQLFYKSNEKKDTVEIPCSEAEKNTMIIFRYGLNEQDLEKYNKKQYQKGNYLVTEYSAKKAREVVQQVSYKENKKGKYYYMIKTVKNNRLINSTTELSFSSEGDFLIKSNQEVPLSYSNIYRVEGRILKK